MEYFHCFIGIMVFWIGWDVMALRSDLNAVMKDISEERKTIATTTEKPHNEKNLDTGG